MMVAALEGHAAAVEVLLEAGASKDLQDSEVPMMLVPMMLVPMMLVPMFGT